MIDAQCDAYTDLAEVLAHAEGQRTPCASSELAVDKYTCKGNVVSARRTEGRLAELAALPQR
jgi:hypothetical protein